MLQNTKTKILKALETMPVGNTRARLNNLYHLTAGSSIASAIEANHRSRLGAYRDALILAQIGAATCKDHDTFIFEDNSTLNFSGHI